MTARIRFGALATVLGLTVLAGSGCGEVDAVNGRLSVVASIYPLGYLTERVGGDLVRVEVLIGPGIEAHGFEPKSSDLRKIAAAELVVMNGLGLEPWLDRALVALEDNRARIVVGAADELEAIAGLAHDHAGKDGDHEEEAGAHAESGDGDEYEDHRDDRAGGQQGAAELDPHVWLDPLLAIVQVERIRDALIEADADNAGAYQANAATVSNELRALQAEFADGLAVCRHDHFVTSHAAYAYLADRFGAEQIPVAGLSPEAEPSPRQLAEITDTVTELGLEHVLVEPVLSDRLAQAIARESDIELLPIHAIGSVTEDELATFGDYFGLMRDNLASLRLALGCS